MGVIVLHYNNPIMGGGFTYSHGLNNMVLYYFESIATCSVDLFMLISGYFMEKCEKRNLWKAIELISQVMIFQIDWYLIGIIRGHEFTVKDENDYIRNYDEFLQYIKDHPESGTRKVVVDE